MTHFFPSVNPNECLEAHNRKRALHVDTSPLEWDDNLAQKAKEWADHLLSITKKLEHSGPGENLFWARGKSSTCGDAVESWSVEAFEWKILLLFDFSRVFFCLCLPVRLVVCLSVCPSGRVSVCLSVCPSGRLSVGPGSSVCRLTIYIEMSSLDSLVIHEHSNISLHLRAMNCECPFELASDRGVRHSTKL